MGLRHLLHYPAFITGLPERIRSIPKLPSYGRRSLGVALLLLALLLGQCAQEADRQSALESWLGSHPPGKALWADLLRIHGYEPVTLESLQARLSRTLPGTLDQPAAIWMSTDYAWVAVFSSELQAGAGITEVQNFFGRKSTGGPKRAPSFPKPVNALKWANYGSGWPALEKILAQLRAQPTPQIPIKPARKVFEIADPRAVRF